MPSVFAINLLALGCLLRVRATSSNQFRKLSPDLPPTGVPLPMNPAPAHRWRIEIVPRLSVVAGLELGAGMHINETAPEAARG